MRPRPAAREKPLHWIGAAKGDLLSFPQRLVSAIGYDLSAVQYGEQPPSAEPWKGLGPGVWELAEHDVIRAACLSKEITRRHPDIPKGHRAHQATAGGSKGRLRGALWQGRGLGSRREAATSLPISALRMRRSASSRSSSPSR